MTTAAKYEATSAPPAVLFQTRVRGVASENATAVWPQSRVSSTLRWGSWQIYDGTAVGRLVGLDYFGARCFLGAQGRFTTPDWSAVPQPVPYADLSNPQTLNLYAYVGNNPLSRRDVDGHLWEELKNLYHGDGYRTDKQLLPRPPDPPRQQPPPPPFLKPNPTFTTVDAAGMAAAKLTNIPTQREKVEYGTRVFRIAPGQYSYSDLVTQKGWRSVDVDDGQKTPRIPPGTSVAGDAHAHPLDPLLEYDRFSGEYGDIGRARLQRVPSYLATPSGSILVYDATRTPVRYEYLEYHK